jgi:hypothetical protein
MLSAFPYQAIQQQSHGYRSGTQAVSVQVNLRQHDKIQEHQEVRDRQAGKTQTAPQ